MLLHILLLITGESLCPATGCWSADINAATFASNYASTAQYALVGIKSRVSGKDVIWNLGSQNVVGGGGTLALGDPTYTPSLTSPYCSSGSNMAYTSLTSMLTAVNTQYDSVNQDRSYALQKATLSGYTAVNCTWSATVSSLVTWSLVCAQPNQFMLGMNSVYNGLRNRTWSIQCCTLQGITCQALSAPTNGAVITIPASRTFPSSANYSCVPGYGLSSKTPQQCTITGQWAGSAPVCQRLSCPALTVTGALLLIPDTLYPQFQSVVTFQCLPGHYPPSGNRTCNATQAWTNILPKCIPVNCTHESTLGTPLNWTRSNSTYPNNVTYRCAAGYSLVGVSTRACTVLGTYQGQLPQCIGIPCAALSTISTSTSTVVSTNKNIFPSTATFACVANYYTSNILTRVCSTNGSWMGASPVCSPRFILPKTLCVNCGYTTVAFNQECNSGVLLANINITTANGTFPNVTVAQCYAKCYANAFIQARVCGGFSYSPRGACLLWSTCTSTRASLNSTSYTLTGSASNNSRLQTTQANEQITLAGYFSSTAVVKTSNITYTSIYLPQSPGQSPPQFKCTIVYWDSNVVTCNTSVGSGSAMLVQIVFQEFNQKITLTSTDTVSYPAPIITPNSIRFVNHPFNGSSVLLTTTNGGDVLLFNGSFFGPNTLQVVKYTDALTHFYYTCSSVPAAYAVLISDTTGVCVTYPGDGGPYYLVVFAADQASNKSLDSLTYPKGPEVDSMQGCEAGIDLTTINCPTAGGIAVTLRGSNFVVSQGDVPVVFIANVKVGLVFYNSSYIIATLPAGTGLDRMVSVSLGPSSTPPWPWMSYARATILGVSGCNNTVDCERVGGDNITLYGENFGADGANVLVGGTQCWAVVHDPITPHSIITCTLPSGKGLDRELCVLQFNGQITFSPFAIAYAQCPPGTHEQSTTTSCQDCDPGKFSAVNGQADCISCSPGEYANITGATECTRSAAGYYVPAFAATEEEPCSPATFSVSAGSISCASCPQGRYNDESARSECRLCEPGRYSASENRTECDPCAPGTWADSYGLLSCVPCAEGFVTNDTASTACEQCTPGTFAQGGKVCMDCAPGSYTSLNGETTCLSCPVGQFAPGPGSIDCTQCLPGQYQATIGSSMCQDCQETRYAPAFGSVECISCDLGTANNRTGQHACMECSPGTAAPVPGSSGCTSCPPGQYAPSPRTQSCAPCEAGRYSASPGTTTCTNCRPGAYQDSEGAAFCVLAPVGHFTTGGLSYYSQCGSNTFSDQMGAANCTSCPFASTSNLEHTSCYCPTGFFLLGDASPNSTYTCQPCPKGAVCNQPGITFGTLAAYPGWWRSSTDTLSFIRCTFPQNCAGGRDSACSGNRRGPLCGICNVGYSARTGSSPCTQCPTTSVAYGTTVGILIAVAAAAVVAYAIVLKMGESQMRRLKKLSTLKARRAMIPVPVRASGWKQGTFSDQAQSSDSTRDGMNNSSAGSGLVGSGNGLGASALGGTGLGKSQSSPMFPENNSNDPQHEPLGLKLNSAGGGVDNDYAAKVFMSSKRAPNLTQKVKILITFFQIGTVLAFQGDVAWPRGFQKFISSFDFINFDFIPWQSVACATPLDVYGKILVVGLTPMVVALGLLLFFFLPMYLRDRMDLSDNNTYRAKRMDSRRKFWKLSLFTTFFLYPHVSNRTLSVFNCIEVDGQYYLATDLSLHCYDHRWRQWVGPCTLFVLIYPIGLPTYYMYLLFRKKNQLHEPETMMELGFLYEAYNVTHWYAELVDMVHKLLVTSLLVFVKTGTQMAVDMTVLSLYAMWILYSNPFVRKGDDRLALLSLCVLFLVALMGWTLSTSEFAVLPESTDTWISAVLITLVMFMFLVALLISVRNLNKILKYYQRKRNTKKAAAQSQADNTNNNATSAASLNYSGGVGGGGGGGDVSHSNINSHSGSDSNEPDHMRRDVNKSVKVMTLQEKDEAHKNHQRQTMSLSPLKPQPNLVTPPPRPQPSPSLPSSSPAPSQPPPPPSPSDPSPDPSLDPSLDPSSPPPPPPKPLKPSHHSSSAAHNLD